MTESTKVSRKQDITRTENVRKKVELAMNLIASEMKANGGIYPENGGAVSLNEVARRAVIGETTLHAPKQKELRQEVSEWLETLKKKATVGRMRVRSSLAERAESWRERYTALEQSHIKTEKDLEKTESELEEARKEVERLQQEVKSLKDTLAKVVPLKGVS